MSDLDDLLADLEEEEEEVKDEAIKDEEVEQEEEKTEQNDVTSIATLLHSAEMQSILQEIDQYAGQEERRIMGILEADPEYHLIVRANDISLEVDNEIRIVVEFIKLKYAERFPELERLVVNPLEYARLVKLIGNEEDLVQLKLNSIVPNAMAMSIAVTATTTDGLLLSPEKLDAIYKACDMAIALDAAKMKIIRYVQSRIEVIAPNVTRIVGPLTAAKLVGQAGGINGLAKLPSCNLPSLGRKQGIMNGYSKIGSAAQGYLYFCELVQSVPEDVRKQALRQISGKVILAARIDSVHESQTGEKGMAYHEELVRKLEKLSEPPELVDVKALPAPDDPKKSRRGGKRIRKAKEKYAITELQKLRNRMAFGKEEAEVGYGDETEGMGMIGSSSSIRAPTIDKRTQAKLPKARMKGGHLVGTAALLNRVDNDPHRLLGNTSGTQSSLSFSSVQGIELPSLNIDALKKAQSDNKWFASGVFSQIKKD